MLGLQVHFAACPVGKVGQMCRCVPCVLCAFGASGLQTLKARKREESIKRQTGKRLRGEAYLAQLRRKQAARKRTDDYCTSTSKSTNITGLGQGSSMHASEYT